MHCLLLSVAFISCKALATQFISPAFRCDGDFSRCLLLSSNSQKPREIQRNVGTRKINTWYPILRKKVLFDASKNSEGGFISNFNKLHPRGADAYPHVNDFSGGEILLGKGKAAEELFIPIWSLTDGENKGETGNRMARVENVAKWNATADDTAMTFVVNNSEKKLKAEPGSIDTHRVNNTFVNKNKLEIGPTTAKPKEEKFRNILADDDAIDLVERDKISRDYLQTEKKVVNKNNSMYASGVSGSYKKPLVFEKSHQTDFGIYSSNGKLAEEIGVDETNKNHELPQPNKDFYQKINKKGESIRYENKKSIFPEQFSRVNFNTYDKANTDRFQSGYIRMRRINIPDSEMNSFKSNLTNEKDKMDNFYSLLQYTENKDDDGNNKYVKTELNRNYTRALNLSEYRSIGNKGPYDIAKINKSQFPKVIETIYLEISHAKPFQLNRRSDDFNSILVQRIRLFKNKPDENTNVLNITSKSTICNTTEDLENNLNVNGNFQETLSKSQPPVSFTKISTEAFKNSSVKDMPRSYSNKRNTHTERRTDSLKFDKLYHSKATNLEKKDFRLLNPSDIVRIFTGSLKSYETRTLVRDKVTTPPSLSNDVFPKSDSVSKFSEKRSKKFELQIDEDSLNKDLRTLNMETGIGDQLGNDIKERESNVGQYNYTGLRTIRGSLKESGKFGKRKILGKEKRKDLLVPFKSLKKHSSDTFNNFQITLLQNGTLKDRNYTNSKNSTLLENHVANKDYFKERLFVSRNAQNNTNTTFLFKLMRFDLNTKNETNNQDKHKLKHKTDLSVSKFRNLRVFPYLRKRQSKKNELTAKLINRNVDFSHFRDRIILSENYSPISSQNTVSFPSFSRNVKFLNVSRQKRQLNRVIFQKQLSGTKNKISNKPLSRDNSISKQVTNVPFHRDAIFSRNSHRKGDNSINNKYLSSVSKFKTGSNVYITDRSPNPIEFSVYQTPNFENNGKLTVDNLQNTYRPRLRKIRDLLRDTNFFNRRKILGRSAIPGRNLTFASYPQNHANFVQEISRPTIRLRNWIKTNIYKEKDPTRISRTLENSSENQRTYPEIILYFLLSSNEERGIESVPNTQKKVLLPEEKSQIESEDDNEDTLVSGEFDMNTNDQGSITYTESTAMQFETGVKNKNGPIISKQYARFEKANSENVTEINDWLNSQWIYINGLGIDQMNVKDEISTITTEIPYFSVTSRTPIVLAKTNTSNSVTTTNKPISSPMEQNTTQPTEEPWQDIQNIPWFREPWKAPNEHWERNYSGNTKNNPFNIAKIPWNSPGGRWEFARMPWYPSDDPWKTDKKTWPTNRYPWKDTKQTWISPVDPWERSKPWVTPTNTWRKENKPWDSSNNQWGKENKPWDSSNNQWGKENKPWDSSNNQWGKENKPWDSSNNQWGKENKPWDSSNDQWGKENKPWDPSNDQWGKENIPWNLPSKRWEKEKKTWNPENNPWEKERKPKQWNPPNNLLGNEKKSWNPSNNYWKNAEIPWVLPTDSWNKSTKQTQIPDYVWKNKNPGNIYERPWKNENNPQSFPNDPWKSVKQSWNPPIHPWKMKNSPWIYPDNLWEKETKYWDAPDETVKTTKSPWVKLNEPWENDKKPWNPPVDPWGKEKEPLKLALEAWKTKKLSWNSAPNQWKINRTPRTLLSNPWKTKNWDIPNDPWKRNFFWWNCKK